MADEKSPLLGSSSDHNLPFNNQSTSGFTDYHRPFVNEPPAIDEGDLPPPYHEAAAHGVPMIRCQVCGFMIDISGRHGQHVVKCHSCNEATPIKDAPPGKKYIRCRCNCLLICKASSQRVACPRKNCKTIINLTSVTHVPHPCVVPGMCQVSCAHCHNPFTFNTSIKALARCPHCRKVSSIGGAFSRKRGIIYLLAAFIALCIGLGVTMGTYASNGAFYVIYIGMFALSLVFLIRSLYFFFMKTSTIERAF